MYITRVTTNEIFSPSNKINREVGRAKDLSAPLLFPIYNHNWRNISTIYIHNKTSIKRNILTIKEIYREVGRDKDLSAPSVNLQVLQEC